MAEGADGTVYLLLSGDGQRIKIGYTGGPIERRKRQIEMQCGERLSVHRLYRGGRDVEKDFHVTLEAAGWRLVGEWFDAAGVLLYLEWRDEADRIALERGLPV